MTAAWSYLFSDFFYFYTLPWLAILYLVLPVLALPDQDIDRQFKRIGQPQKQLLAVIIHPIQNPVAGVIYDRTAVKTDNIADILL